VRSPLDFSLTTAQILPLLFVALAFETRAFGRLDRPPERDLLFAGIRLYALAAALGVPVTELLAGAPVGEVHIVRVSETHPWPPQEAAQRLLQDTVKLRGSLQIIELALPAHHAAQPEPRRAGSREAVLVLHGKLIAGPVEHISELASGDYASFPADGPYRYETSRAPARALVLKHTAG
jgi:hypothetical protein